MLLILHFFFKIFDGVFCASLAHFSTNQHSVIHVKQCAGNCSTMQKKVEVHWPKCNYESFNNQFFSFLLAFIDLYAFVVRQKPPSGTGGISTDYTKQPHSPSQSWKTTIGLLHLYAND